MLGRSLLGLRDLVDSTLAEVRLAEGIERRERLSVASFVDKRMAKYVTGFQPECALLELRDTRGDTGDSHSHYSRRMAR